MKENPEIVIVAKDLNRRDKEVRYDRYPDRCPICHRSIEAIETGLGTYFTYDEFDHYIQVVFRCPDRKCSQLFISEYKSLSSDGVYYKYSYSYPSTQRNVDFQNEIQEISPKFVKIYNQAAKAESLKLDEISGIGYRKAVEFLVKDYCSLKDKKNEKVIKNEYMGIIIKNRIDDERIKVCAEKAIWLGNDQAHYTQIWDQYNIDDLKNLIRITVNWIVSEVVTAKYAREMTDKKPKSPN
jgi:hypothetical protein